MTILLSLSHEEAQRLRSILQDANEPTLLQKIEEELQRLQELDDFLAKSASRDLSLDDLSLEYDEPLEASRTSDTRLGYIYL